MAKLRTLTETIKSNDNESYITTKVYPVTVADGVYIYNGQETVTQAFADANEKINTVESNLSNYKTTVEDTYLKISNNNKAGGYLKLNDSNLIDSQYLPGYVDDVVEYDTVDDFPQPGETGKIYIDVNTSTTYRWTGSTYVIVGGKSVSGVAMTATAYSALSDGEKYNDTVYYITDGVSEFTGFTVLSQAEYDALSDDEKNQGRIFCIYDSDASDGVASGITYDNTKSGSSATTVQNAIDDLYAKLAALNS